MLRVKNKLAALAVVAIAPASLLLSVPAASADPDPVTSGTTTIELTVQTVKNAAAHGIFAIPTKPATVTYDPTASTVEYALPVTGGDGSVNTTYGDIEHAGGLLIFDARTHKTVSLTDIKFTIQDDTVSATPSGSTTPVVLFDALGEHEYTLSQPESFSASELQVDPAGAAYLNKALHCKVFTAGQVVGSFSTTFSNSVDAG